jgi:hypothetical protein
LQVVRHAVDFGFALRQQRRRPPVVSSAVGRERRGRATGLGAGAVRLSARTSASSALRYAKRAIVLPIGERWALLSLCAAIGGPRVAFLALLAWGGLAALYTLSGRVLRSFAEPAGQGPGPATLGDYLDYLDVGAPAVFVELLARRTWPRRSPATGTRSRLWWLVPAGLRAVEYGFVVAVADVVGNGALPAAYALLVALSVHHYDLVYRVRYARLVPPWWLAVAGGGIEVRMLLVGLLALAGAPALRLGLAVLAAMLAVLFVAESGTAWARWLRTRPAAGALSVDEGAPA